MIRDDILSGRLRPGERLTEAAVMARTGVSRTPIREGFRRLEAEGLVTGHRGRGTYVSHRLSPDEALVIYDCRLVLEPHLTRLVAERRSAETLAAIGAVTERFGSLADGSLFEAGQLDADFHLAIYEASGSELTGVVQGYWSRLQLELSDLVYRKELPRFFVREHFEIYEALVQQDGDLAEERMRSHILHGRQVLEQALRAAAASGSSSESG